MRQRLLVSALLTVAATRAALWLLPFSVVRQLVAGRLPLADLPPSPPATAARQVARAVQRASRFVPAATCLTQSLALQLLLAWRGRASSVRIGVASNDTHGFHSHAWVVCGGEILLSDADEIEGYRVITSLEPT